MSKLLEKAKEIETKINANKFETNNEEIELAIAWIKEEIKTTQVAKVLEFSSDSYIYPFICRTIREAYKQGKITLSQSKSDIFK